jgi:hypothetical protein
LNPQHQQTPRPPIGRFVVSPRLKYKTGNAASPYRTLIL